MRLIANCQLTGDYGTVATGEAFVIADDLALKLISQGCARRADPPRILYETKPYKFETPTIKPEAPEVSARPPFRDLLVPDPKPQTLSPESDPVLPKPNVSEQGTVDSSGRGRRKGSASER